MKSYHAAKAMRQSVCVQFRMSWPLRGCMALTNSDGIILYIWNNCIFCIEIQVLRPAWFLHSGEGQLCNDNPCLSNGPRLCIVMCTLCVVDIGESSYPVMHGMNTNYG